MSEFVIRSIIAIIFMVVFFVMVTGGVVIATWQTPEQICAQQQRTSDFCKSLLNNPNLILKK